jgi:hypothetical protein
MDAAIAIVPGYRSLIRDRRTNMNIVRLLAALCVCAILAPAAGVAQSPPSPSTATLLKQNPLIGQVEKIDSDGAWDLVKRLQIMAARPAQDFGPKRGSQPTAEEAQQLAANPVFRQAYDKDPAAALDRLRETNKVLSRARPHGA